MKHLWLLVLALLGSPALGAGADAIPPSQIITACAMTGSAVCTSTVVDIRHFRTVGIQAIWTGTPTGTFAIEVSEDYNQATGAAGTWKALSATLTSPAGSAANAIADNIVTGMGYIRVTYTNSGSTGTLNVFLSAKTP